MTRVRNDLSFSILRKVNAVTLIRSAWRHDELGSVCREVYVSGYPMVGAIIIFLRSFRQMILLVIYNRRRITTRVCASAIVNYFLYYLTTDLTFGLVNVSFHSHTRLNVDVLTVFCFVSIYTISAQIRTVFLNRLRICL